MDGHGRLCVLKVSSFSQRLRDTVRLQPNWTSTIILIHVQSAATLDHYLLSSFLFLSDSAQENKITPRNHNTRRLSVVRLKCRWLNCLSSELVHMLIFCTQWCCGCTAHITYCIWKAVFSVFWCILRGTLKSWFIVINNFWGHGFLLVWCSQPVWSSAV